MFNPSQMPLNF